jgi:hypothetical protein
VLGWGLLFLLVAPGAASGEAPSAKRDPAQMSVADIRACMRANVVDRGSLREIELRSVDREGQSQKLRMKLFWKPAKDGAAARTVLQVVEPAESAGAAWLAISRQEGDEVYVYMPALGKVQRVSGDQNRSLFGTDFSYADIEQVQALAEGGGIRRVADEKVFERSAFVLDVASDMATSGYTRIKSYVDQATCTLLKSEFFVVSDEPKKVLEADLTTLVEIDPWWLVLGYTMENRRTGTHTELTLSNVFLLEQLPEALFDPATFHRVTP